MSVRAAQKRICLDGNLRERATNKLPTVQPTQYVTLMVLKNMHCRAARINRLQN